MDKKLLFVLACGAKAIVLDIQAESSLAHECIIEASQVDTKVLHESDPLDIDEKFSAQVNDFVEWCYGDADAPDWLSFTKGN